MAQILRAGRLVILCVPGELTTMAGRRLKRAVQATVGGAGAGAGWGMVLGGGGQGQAREAAPGWNVARTCQAPARPAAAAAAVARMLRRPRGRCAQVGAAWGEGLHIVVAGLTNTYASYITTPEEYAAQRYEGGFTLYGQHTLDAYIQASAGGWVGLVGGWLCGVWWWWWWWF